MTNDTIDMLMKNKDILQFEWDSGNEKKNWTKHRVKKTEAEEVFFDSKKRKFPDPIHSTQEVRHIIIGETKKGRILVIICTIRGNSVRIISARDINKRKEGNLYEKTNQTSSIQKRR